MARTLELRDHARFLLAFDADAIRRIAASRAALPTGFVLVATAAIARTYDANDWRTEWMELLAPFLLSLAAAALLYAFVYGVFLRHAPEGGGGFASFLGVFWATAPCAWLYVIPFERFLTPAGAARANIALLAIVATWRVALMSRALVVLTGASPLRALAAVLLPSCLEVFALAILGLLGAIARAMGGLRLVEEDAMVARATDVAFLGAVGAFAASMVVLAATYKRAPAVDALPVRVPERVPATALGGWLAAWLLVAVFPQGEVRRSAFAERLAQDDREAEAIAYLSTLEPDDLAPSRGTPFSSRGVWESHARAIEAIGAGTKPWVREMLLDAIERGLEAHGKPGDPDWRRLEPREWRKGEGAFPLLPRAKAAIEKLPGGVAAATAGRPRLAAWLALPLEDRPPR